MEPLTPEQASQAAQAITSAVETGAEQAGIQIEEAAAERAPGLETGAVAPGGYRFQQQVAPTIDPLTSALVVDTQQQVLKDVLGNARQRAQARYENAQRNYRLRERQHQRSLSLLQEQQQSRSAGGGGSSGGGAGGSSGGMQTISGISTTGRTGTPSASLKNPNDPSQGYAFTDAQGNPVSAMTYARLTDQPSSRVFEMMARTGDRGAQQVMSGSDTSPEYRAAYEALTWR